jgi:hypothetical protein
VARTDVSIWASELVAGTLPSVCVKSGQRADRRLKFRFGELTYGGGRLLLSMFLGMFAFLGGPNAVGQLALTKRWRTTFRVLRGVALSAFPVGIAVLFSTGAWPEQWRPSVVGIAFGLLGLYALTHSLYAVLRPKGTVHRTSFGELWIHLRDVHPNFVAAVQAMEAEVLASRTISPDGQWYWDGLAWRPIVPEHV